MTAAASLDVAGLVSVLDELAAFSLAEGWDNVGLMVGDPAQRVGSILVALDPTEEVLDEAMANGCNVIVTHHPLIFKPLKSIRTDQPLGRILTRAMSAGVALIACHTNLDLAEGGVNDVLAALFGLQGVRSLAGEDGFGRIGGLPKPVSGREMMARMAEVLGVEVLPYAGALPEAVDTIAVCGGSGSDLAEMAYGMGAQMYVTGEVKHSVARWAEAAGFCIVDGGHFATEYPVVPAFTGLLQQTFAGRKIAVEVKAATVQRNPFKYFIST